MKTMLLSAIALLLVAGCLTAGCTVDEGDQPPPKRMTLTLEVRSDAFANGTSIPARYTCDGDDVSPPLSWNGVPEDAKSLALIVDDPDAPGGSFTHWIVYNISPEEKGLAEGLPREQHLPGGLRQGVNSFGTTGYGGPCPPSGTAHRYTFHLYALNQSPDLPKDADRAALEAWMRGRVVAEGVLVGTYRR